MKENQQYRLQSPSNLYVGARIRWSPSSAKLRDWFPVEDYDESIFYVHQLDSFVHLLRNCWLWFLRFLQLQSCWDVLGDPSAKLLWYSTEILTSACTDKSVDHVCFVTQWNLIVYFGLWHFCCSLKQQKLGCGIDSSNNCWQSVIYPCEHINALE